MENVSKTIENQNSYQRLFITRTDEAKFCNNWIAFFQNGSLDIKDFSPYGDDLHSYFKEIFDKGLAENKPLYFTEAFNNMLRSFHFFPIKLVADSSDKIIEQVLNTNFCEKSPSIGIYIDHNLLNTSETAEFLSNLMQRLSGKVENFYLLTNDLGLNSALNIAKQVKNSSTDNKVLLYH